MTKQIVIPGLVPTPPDPRARWWMLGIFDDNGRLLLSTHVVVGPTRLADLPLAIGTIAGIFANQHIVVTTGEPEHVTVYEVSHGDVILDRRSEYGP